MVSKDNAAQFSKDRNDVHLHACHPAMPQLPFHTHDTTSPTDFRPYCTQPPPHCIATPHAETRYDVLCSSCADEAMLTIAKVLSQGQARQDARRRGEGTREWWSKCFREWDARW
jgi:hypothetical protein